MHHAHAVSVNWLLNKTEHSHIDKDKDLSSKDKDKDKDLSSKDKDQDKDCIVKDKYQDKDCILVLKESLRTRTRTRTNITVII